MAPLASAAEAALRAELSVRHGRHSLSQSLIVNVLVTFLAARGEGINDLPFDVDRDDESTWEREWRQLATSAGVADNLDIDRLIFWLRARSRPIASSRDSSGISNVALTTLEKAGVTITNDQAAAMQAAVIMAEAGAAQAQSTSTLCVFLLYFGRPGSIDECDRYERELAALGGIPDGKVRITAFESYSKMLNKSNSIVIERALKSPSLWRDYKTSQGSLFSAHGLDKASLQWNKVVASAEKTAPGDMTLQLAYLRGYFFDEFLGRGMPEVRGVQSSLTILGTLRGEGADQARNLYMMPTVPTAFDLALSGGGSVEEFVPSIARFQPIGQQQLAPRSAPGSSSSGSNATMSSAGGVSRDELADVMAAAVASALQAAGIGQAAAVGAPATNQASSLDGVECRFCLGPIAACKGQCAQASRGFNLVRQDIKKNLEAKKRREEEQKLEEKK